MMKKTKNSLIIIDSHHLCHRSKFSLVGLTKDEKRTGVIFGFLNQIIKLAKTLKSRRLVFTWETPLHLSLRRRIYPGYKVKDIEMSPEDAALEEICVPQFSIIQRQVLPALGFENNFWDDGYEADDVIASIVMDPRYKDEDKIVVTRDQDMYQLLDHCIIYDPSEEDYFGTGTLFKKWGVTPEQWKEVKAIAGCSSDRVPGIPKVGEATAIKYLFSQLKPSYKAYQDIRLGRETIERNRRLVYLPFPGVRSFDITEGERFFRKDFIDVCFEYGFKSFLTGDRINTWERIFCGDGEK